jgi:hypothetical protein
MLTNQANSLFAAPFRPNFTPRQEAPKQNDGVKMNEQLVPHSQPVKDIHKVFNFLADHGGCGCWRVIWPELIMNLRGDLMSFNSVMMTKDDGLYGHMKTIRIQRQATPQQLEFVKYLKFLQSKFGFRLVYEIDDVVFREDIPDYNKFKTSFTSDAIRKSSEEIMNLCDEVTVTCQYMKDYYKSKLTNQNVTVIPNYVPKFWMGNFYDKDKLLSNLEKNARRPRILYNGSAAHFDVDDRVKQKDDFYHVNEAIIKTIKKFRWVFMGALPRTLVPYLKSGDIEFVPWSKIMDYPYTINDLNVQMMVAPLANNTFNKCKSDLKYLESSCYGIPVACQDIETYKNAPIRFNTGDEMIDQINETLKEGVYKRAATAGRKFAESRFLETPDNIGKFVELYKLPYGSTERKLINTVNS